MSDLSLHCLLERLLKHFSRRQKQTIFVVIGALRVKSSQLGHDLPASVKDRVISLFFKGFISQKFASVKFCENETLTKTF